MFSHRPASPTLRTRECWTHHARALDSGSLAGGRMTGDLISRDTALRLSDSPSRGPLVEPPPGDNRGRTMTVAWR